MKIFRSGLLAAFLFIPLAGGCAELSEQNYSQKQLLELSRHPAWHALLHLRRGEPQITDTKFLLAATHFSPLEEMIQTLRFIHQSRPPALCRFPARYLWLKKMLALKNVPELHCPEIDEFDAKAPHESIAYVFASENVSAPASVLGHSFLKFSGVNQAGKPLSHAVSFYTDADSVNAAKLLWESMVTGKKGLFSLFPYSQEEDKYLDKEQRNLWQFELDLSPEERALIRNHLFELRQVDLTYFFHSYNCASVLRNIIATTGRLPPTEGLWETPKSTLRDIASAGLVRSKRVVLSDAWMVAQISYSGRLEKHRSFFRDDFFNASGDIDRQPTTGFEYVYARSRNELLHSNGDINSEQWKHNDAKLTSIPASQAANDAIAVLTPMQSPAEAQPEKSLSLRYATGQSHSSVSLRWAPLSHRLSDRQDSYQDTGLEMFSATAALESSGNLALEDLTLYSMQSMNPTTPAVSTISSMAYIGYSAWHHLDMENRELRAELLVGKAFQAAGVHSVALLAGAACGANSSMAYCVPRVNATGIAKLTPGLKLIVQYDYFAQDTAKVRNKLTLNLALSVSKHSAFNLFYETAQTPLLEKNGGGLEYRWMY